jgi:hypothetical protein
LVRVFFFLAPHFFDEVAECVHYSLLVLLNLDLLSEAVLYLLGLHFNDLVLETGLVSFQNRNALVIITAHLNYFRLDISTINICQHALEPGFIQALEVFLLLVVIEFINSPLLHQYPLLKDTLIVQPTKLRDVRLTDPSSRAFSLGWGVHFFALGPP